jgi:hypothetical protein
MLEAIRQLLKIKAPAAPLRGDGLLASDLWVDQPGAERRIDKLLKQGAIDERQAAGLARFVADGYLTFALDASSQVFADLLADIERLWRERPSDVAFARVGPLIPFSAAAPKERQPSYRLSDLHSHSEAALALYLNRSIFRWVELILGQPAVATQSLFFEFGSQQALHRDPVFVQTKPPAHLVAAWIALEDIDPRSGPLLYVPGSHRLPYYQFEPGRHLFDHSRHGSAEAQAMERFDREQYERQGMKPVVFTPKRGEVLLWHHSLLHGGAGIEDPGTTRRSFVVHYSTLATFEVRRQRFAEAIVGEDGQPAFRRRIRETETILTRDGCHGLDNPMRGYLPATPAG